LSQANFDFIAKAASMRSSTDIRRTRSISACLEAFAQVLDRPLSGSVCSGAGIVNAPSSSIDRFSSGHTVARRRIFHPLDLEMKARMSGIETIEVRC
jgi:hypothetical protein